MNAEERAVYNREYSRAHREELSTKQRIYREAHREQIAAYNRQYAESHQAEISARQKINRELRKGMVIKVRTLTAWNERPIKVYAMVFKGCPKCGGTQQTVEDGLSCMNCGKVVYAVAPDNDRGKRYGGHTRNATYKPSGREKE